MKCEECREKLSVYLDGAAEDAAEIEAHLAGCAACRKEKEILEEMMAALNSLPDEELPEGYHAELMQKLQAEAAPNVAPFPKKKKPRWRQMSMIAAAALIVVAVGGGNGILQMRQEQQEAVQQMEMDAEKISVYDTEEAVAEEMPDSGSATQAEKKQMTGQEVEQPQTPVQEVKKLISKKPVQTQQNETAKPKTQNVVVEKRVQTATPEADVVAMPNAVSETAEEDAVYEAAPSPYTEQRSVNTFAKDQAILYTTDISAAKEKISAAITEAGGYEEAAAETEIVAMIPTKAYDSFVETVEGLGELEWTKQEQIEADAEYHGVDIQLKEKQ